MELSGDNHFPQHKFKKMHIEREHHRRQKQYYKSDKGMERAHDYFVS